MWDEDGDWNPGQERIEKVLSKNPSLSQKEDFIERLIKKSLHKRVGNYPEVIAEILDHYINALGDQMNILSKIDFIEAVENYHHKFGGTKRIVKIGSQHEMAVSKLIRYDFSEWVKPYRLPLFLVGLFLLLEVGYFYTPLMSKVMLVLTFVLSIILMIDGAIKLKKLKRLKNADAIVSKFLRAPMEVYLHLLYIPMCSTFTFEWFVSAENAKYYSTLLMLFGAYMICLLYFYHSRIQSKVLQKKIQELEIQLVKK